MAPTKIKKGYILIPVFYLIFSISFLILHFTDNKTSDAHAKDTIFILDREALTGLNGENDSAASVILQSGNV